MAPALQAKAPFTWYGGKHRLAPHIVALIPPHEMYVEVFGGSGAVLFSKQRARRLDVYNDRNSGAVSFLRVLRDRPEELAQRLTLTPYARQEYIRCRETWQQVDDEVERARRWFVATAQAYGGGGRSACTGWSANWPGVGSTPQAKLFARRIDSMLEFAARLRGVQIECLDWRECITRYDGDDVVMYLDPPYLPETRIRATDYVHEMDRDDHAELLARVVDLRATVIISGYESEMYEEALQGFERRTYNVPLLVTTSGGGRARRTEVVWRRCSELARDTLFGPEEMAG